mgnify:CR=1 FL=1
MPPRRIKQTYLHAKKEDIVIVDSPVGMPGRAIRTGSGRKKKAGESRSENVISVSLPVIRRTHHTVSPERWCMQQRVRRMMHCCFAEKTHGGVKRWSMWRILWRNLREREKRIRNIRTIRRVEKKKNIFHASFFEKQRFHCRKSGNGI